MSAADMIPTLDDKALANFAVNARRLELSGTSKQKTDAAGLLPLIEAEIASRKAKAPPKAARKPSVRKAKVKAEVPAEEEEPVAEADSDEAESEADTDESEAELDS